jgi:hypothetical protein
MGLDISSFEVALVLAGGADEAVFPGCTGTDAGTLAFLVVDVNM